MQLGRKVVSNFLALSNASLEEKPETNKINFISQLILRVKWLPKLEDRVIYQML